MSIQEAMQSAEVEYRPGITPAIEAKARHVYQTNWRQLWGYVHPADLDYMATRCAMSYGATIAEARGILAGIHQDAKHGMLCPVMAALALGEV